MNTEVVPHDSSIVEALVGALILDDGKAIQPFFAAYPHWRDLIYDEGLVALIDAANELLGAGQSCDPITINAKSKEQFYLQERGGIRFIAGLTNLVSGSSAWEHFAATANDFYIRRQLDFGSKMLSRAAASGDQESTARALKIIAEVSAPPTTSLAERLKARRFDPAYQPQELRVTYSLAGVPIATPGNLQAINAGVKVGKTAAVGGMIAATMATAGTDTLSFESANPNEFAVLHFDTEQSKDDYSSNLHRAIHRAGRTVKPEWLVSHFLTGMSPRKKREAVWMLAELAAKEFGGIHSILVDGIADLVKDVNNPEESNEFVDSLHGLAIERDCPIACVIHFNPGGEKTRGHLGSQLERRAETNLRLDKDGEITSLWSEKQRRAPIVKGKGPCFQWSVEAGMHVSVEPKESAAVREAKFLCGEVFNGIGGLRYSELKKRVQEVTEKSSATAQRHFDKWVQLGVIEKSFGGVWIPKT